MTIDTSGQWWVGTSPSDIAAYLAQLAEYEVHEYRQSECSCSSQTFHVEYDAEESCVKRYCAECGAEHFICDSAEYASEADFSRLSCVECESDRANVGVGFSLRDERKFLVFRAPSEPRWVYVGVRCAECGVLGSIADWKIDYTPAGHLMDQA